MTYLDRAIKDGYAIITGPENKQKIIYVTSDNHTENYNDPEEKVRAEFWAELIYEYDYPAHRIKVEVTIPDRVPTDRADIVIFSDDECKKPYAVVECKRDGVTDAEFLQAIEQGVGNATWVKLRASYVVIIAGATRRVLDFSDDSTGILERENNIIADLPKAYGKPQAFRFYRGGEYTDADGKKKKAPDIQPVAREDLITAIKKCHNTLWGGGRLSPPTAFGELCKLIFVKISDEQKPRKKGEPYQFQIKTHEPSSKLAKRINALYNEQKVKDPEVFTDSIKVDDRVLRTVVSHLESINLNKTDLDVKGVAFEQFMDGFFKGDFGQYFTPRPIIEFAVKMMKPEHDWDVLDPACGSGGFLLHALDYMRSQASEYYDKDTVDYFNYWHDFASKHLYGIEINDFAVTVAKTALWIAESQMMKETEKILLVPLEFLPLKTNAYIVEGNALRVDWESVVSKSKLNYIMGNPPFIGARLMGKDQKSDVNAIFPGWKNAGNLDYVCCWYKKTSDMMQGTSVRSALVSTNSVSQGESVANLWKPLFDGGVHIDFAYRTFRWDSEAKIKAHVHCVIIGFSVAANSEPKKLFDGDRYQVAENINGYLLDGENVFVESRSKPICNVPEIGIGNKPIDGGFFLFEKEEMDDFIKKEPASKKYFRPWYGSREFINQKPRYCLWLGECTPAELKAMPHCMERVKAVREYRLASPSAGTVKLADKPTHFHVENMPKGNYIVIPEVSSEKRKYIPMGFFFPEVLCSNLVKIIPDTTLYHFGVLTSNVHMAWVRAVCGRLKSDYRYSKDIVYNNFPWPEPTDAQKEKITQTARGILDARALYPDSSLAAVLVLLSQLVL